MAFCKNCGAKIDTHNCYNGYGGPFCNERCYNLYMDSHPDKKREEGIVCCWALGSMGYVFGLKSIFHFGVVYAIIGFIVMTFVCSLIQIFTHNNRVEKIFFRLSMFGMLLLVVDIAVLVVRMFINN